MGSLVPAPVSKTFRKLAMATLLAALTLLVGALWLYVSGRGDYAEQRAARIAELETRRAELSTGLTETRARLAADETALDAQRRRLAQADKVLKNLHEQDPGALDRLIGDKAGQAAHADRVARADKIRTETQARIAELERAVAAGVEARGRLASEFTLADSEHRALLTEGNAASHYLRQAWTDYGWVAAAVFGVYMFGGLVVALLLYYGWAGLMAGRRPLRLRDGSGARPSFTESATMADHMLWPGERLWVRKDFLHAADGALTRKSRFVPEWGRAFSWWLAGGARLAELRNERSNGERQVVFASRKDPFAELTVASVPEGGSFVARAGHVMGLIGDIGRAPVIRRHWRPGSWYSWVAGQFGYLEFHGPCRIVLSCVGAVSDDTLESPDETQPASVRVPVAGLVGFTPQLALLPVRTERFWKYCRRQTPLFDLRIAGDGAYLLRNTDRRGGDRLRARVLRRIGL